MPTVADNAASGRDDALPVEWDEVWVLVMDQEASPCGRNWFMQWTGIGPAGTWDEAEAASFPSEQAAMQSPAFSFPMTFYKPERIAP
jgi:hypothetical protein